MREEAQGISEGWSGGTPSLALELTQGGETAVLPGFQEYLHCRLQSNSSASPSGRYGKLAACGTVSACRSEVSMCPKFLQLPEGICGLLCHAQ